MNTLPYQKIILSFLFLICVGCAEKEASVPVVTVEEKEAFIFKLLDSSQTKVKFRNAVSEDNNLNYIKYESIYNGAGVAIGDINNDGLPDIYFAGNGSNDKLYINTGNLVFKDITNFSGVGNHAQGWSTGVNMIDINADGYLDIYVCRSGAYPNPLACQNKLFINNKNATFTESAENYGLNSMAQSRQTAFFDYDLDGDLDMYLMNQPPKDFKAGEFFNYVNKIKNKELQTDVFYENINGKFVDKTKASGLVNFGYGHSIAVADINNDGYPDFHKTNDFDDPDLLFINNQKKGFTNEINKQFKHISWSSMGNDFADINNDGLLDLFALEMAPDDHVRSKVNMKAMDPIKFNALVENDMNHQYMFNTLQLNNGSNSFSEVAQIAGVAKTDWSWSCLFFDMDNDGNKDIFISNGIKRDFLNRDLSKNTEAKSNELGRVVNINEFHDLIPSTVSDNIIFKNNGNITFKKATQKWMDKYNFNTNGVAYGDLDNDGDLDLVTNNMEDIAGIYENKSTTDNNHNYVKFLFKGPTENPFAIGTKVIIEQNGKTFIQELYNTRGYLSSMNYELAFGLGNIKNIDEVKIIWPNQKVSFLRNLAVNNSYLVSFESSGKVDQSTNNQITPLLSKIESKSLGITYKHLENKHDDYKKQVLLPYSQSTHGPFINKADVNNDGLEDFYIGGAHQQAGELYLQKSNGTFKKTQNSDFEKDKTHEDLGVLFFDADNDQDQDLYVVSGGAEFTDGHENYQDRLYINDGKGNFKRSIDALPKIATSGQVVKASDIDNDGDLDLFIGGRIVPDKYPYPAKSHVLLNTNGKFDDATKSIAPHFKELGLITGAEFFDYDNDGDQDLMTVGEWTKVVVHINNNGTFSEIQPEGLEHTRGLWFSLNQSDIDGDGDQDFIAGNIGLNTKFKAEKGKEFHVFSDDFDNSGTYDVILSNTYNGNLVPVRGRECSSEQMPYIKERFESFQSFAEADISDIIGTNNLNNALHYKADILYSVYIENLGNGKFKSSQLPNEAQLAPIMHTNFVDLDGDGKKEILTLGNLHNVEVETVRFDASPGAILKVNNSTISLDKTKTGLYLNKDSKFSVQIGKHLIITNNNDTLDVFKIN